MQCFKFRSKGSVCVLHICQIGFVSARGYILICPSARRGVFVPVQSRRRPQLGVSGQQTHGNIWVKRQSATSLSVPPRCLLSYGLTRSRNCSTPQTQRHTCTLSINSKTTHTHTRAQRPHISFKPGSRLFWQFVLCLLLPPSYFFCLFCFGFSGLWGPFVPSRLPNVRLFAVV